MRKDASDWYSYQADKLKPKPSHQRPAPAAEVIRKLGLNERVPRAAARPREEEIVVEESTASDSMIMRIIGKFRGQ